MDNPGETTNTKTVFDKKISPFIGVETKYLQDRWDSYAFLLNLTA